MSGKQRQTNARAADLRPHERTGRRRDGKAGSRAAPPTAAGRGRFTSIRFQPIVLSIGTLLCIIATAMLLPCIVDIADSNSDWQVFLSAAAITLFVGGLMVLSGNSEFEQTLSLKEGFVLTSACWVVVAAFAALPFLGLGLGAADAYFEAMSGLTTTGATVLTNLGELPRGILLWRAILQGLGGIGMVVTAIILLPFLRIGGMQLFQTESSDQSEKILPRAAQLATATAAVYIGLIVACTAAFKIFGMTGFDAFCHALATVSTGGFSTHDESFGFFRSPVLEWTAIVFMLLGALPFVLLMGAAAGRPGVLFKDQQARGFLAFTLSVSLILAIWLVVSHGGDWEPALRNATFSVVSIVTTTGFATEDYTAWGPMAVGVFFLLTFMGGCAGSTSGGIKTYRLQVTGLLIERHLNVLVSPHRVISLFYNGRRLPDDAPFAIVSFMAVYFLAVGVLTMVLAALGLDFVTSLSAAATAISNVGPGLGEVIGPAGNFAPLPAAAKWSLSAAMLIGRLEVFTFLVLLQPAFWRR